MRVESDNGDAAAAADNGKYSDYSRGSMIAKVFTIICVYCGSIGVIDLGNYAFQGAQIASSSCSGVVADGT